MDSKVGKILECYRHIKEMAAGAAVGGGMTTQSSPGKPGFSRIALELLWSRNPRFSGSFKE